MFALRYGATSWFGPVHLADRLLRVVAHVLQACVEVAQVVAALGRDVPLPRNRHAVDRAKVALQKIVRRGIADVVRVIRVTRIARRHRHDRRVAVRIQAERVVILVIFLFLRTVSATIIPALAVPISLIATCAVMYAFNFSINNMTLLALTLSVGFVVDDAIVMLENIVRHIEGGMRPFEAALKGAREIGFTIISITVSLIAVFIPVLLMGGMVGRVFREFAVTIAVAIIISGFVSLTLTPMLCARVLRTHHEGEKQNVVLRAFEWMFNMWLKGYEWTPRQGAEIQVHHAAGDLRHDGGHGLSLRRHPEGLLPGRGHRLHLGEGRGTGRHLVPRDARTAECDRRRSCGRTRRSPIVNSTVGVGGPNSTDQHRQHVRRPEAEGRARPVRPGAATAAARDRQRRRHAGLLPRDPEHQSGRAHRQGRVPVHDAVERDRHALSRVRRDAGADQDHRGPARRQQRPLHQEPRDRDRDRSREGRVLRHHAGPDPPGALQRVRQPPGRHDLHADQRLPDHSGDAAGLPARRERPVEDLSQDQPRQHQRRDADGRRRDGHRHAERHVDPDQRRDAARAQGRSAAGQPPGPAALGDDLVQPQSGRLARFGGGRDPSDRARRRTCRCRSPPASRATRRCSRSR